MKKDQPINKFVLEKLFFVVLYIRVFLALNEIFICCIIMRLFKIINMNNVSKYLRFFLITIYNYDR